jgi:hypothetical protein
VGHSRFLVKDFFSFEVPSWVYYPNMEIFSICCSLKHVSCNFPPYVFIVGISEPTFAIFHLEVTLIGSKV